MGRYIQLDDNNKVIAIRTGPYIVEGEIESFEGNIGQIMQPDGTFITPDPVPQPVVPTLEEQLTELRGQVEALQAQNLVLMDALATIYETITTGGV